jgi:uncharacterized protein YvpB/outer membrane murein-binding lipoprotein Lpp
MKYIKQTSKLGIGALLLGVALVLGGLSAAYAAAKASSVETASSIQAAATNTVQQASQTSPTAQSQAVSSDIVVATPTSTPVETANATSASTPTVTSQQQTSLPSKAVIANFPSLAQAYNLSCEYAAASAVTLYWGNQVSEKVFVNQVPSSPNPHLGFRGNINGAFGGINDYGVYAEALVPVLEKYGYNANVFYGGVSTLKASIAAGNPVVVWITAGKYTARTPVVESYNGETFTLVPGEHAVVIYGYDSGGVYIMDVSNGGFYYTEWASFLTRWSYFDQMALVITPK